MDYNKLIHLIDDLPEYPRKRDKKKPASATIKSAVKERDKNVCQICGYSSDYNDLEVHHIIPWGDSTPENLISLCSHCHRAVHTLLYVAKKWRFIPSWLNHR
jgi:5-methylcytosine-specific restriction endonuclease McrA